MLLFGLFIFEYGKLGLLDKGVHKLFEGIQNFFLVENISIKNFFSFDFLKSQGVQLQTLAPT